MRAEQLTDLVTYHGEGPVWSASWGGLRLVDMLAGDVLSMQTDGTVVRRHVGRVAAAVRPRRHGGAVIAVERGFVLEEPDGSLTQLDQIWADEQVRMNEGACDPDGRFYCGSMAYDQRPGAGTLCRLDTDRSVHAVLDGVTISNGLEWSADGTQAYYNDTATHQISVFDYDPRSGLTGRRRFAAVADGGSPDGLALDDQGGVWTAVFDRGEVHRYNEEGRLDEVVEVPVRQVTACTFGGPRLGQLFITTSREGLDADEDPLAGSVFTADVGVCGLPVREYAG
jgi:sugar lactone lactonase YvrE